MEAMTPTERNLLLVVARVLLSLAGWGSVGPAERGNLRKAIDELTAEAQPPLTEKQAEDLTRRAT
jgi:hypothetical protein